MQIANKTTTQAIHVDIPPEATSSRVQNIQSLRNFRRNRDLGARQRHRDEVTSILDTVLQMQEQKVVICPTADCSAQIPATQFVGHLENHNELFFSVWCRDSFCENHLTQHYQKTPVDPILLRLIYGTAPEIAVLKDHGDNILKRFIFTCGNYLLTPDPISTVLTGDEGNFATYAKENGLHYNAWWIHPHLAASAWWANRDAPISRYSASGITKPSAYKSSIMDLGPEDALQLKQLYLDVADHFDYVFDIDGSKLEAFVHFPYVERLSTFHIHFKYSIPDSWSNSTRRRVSTTLGEIISDLGKQPYKYRYRNGYRGMGGPPAHILTLIKASPSLNSVKIQGGELVFCG